MDEPLKLNQLLDSDLSVAAIRGAGSDALVAAFKRLSLTTGRAVYKWTPANGLYRLGAEHILIPRTRQPADVLSYILSSRHFGVYLLDELGDELTKPSIQRLVQRVAEKNDGVRRLVLLVDEQAVIPAVLDDVVGVVRVGAARGTGTLG